LQITPESFILYIPKPVFKEILYDL